LVTFPLRRQRVQTLIRLEPPGVAVRTDLTLGLKRRFETLWAWLIRWPATDVFPQMSHAWAMESFLARSGDRGGFIQSRGAGRKGNLEFLRT